MKRLLNTLYVTTQGTYLAREGETVLVRVEKQTRLRVPIHTLGGIVCFGRVSMSPGLMGLCGERKILVSFLKESGRFLARVQGPVSGNVLLRREQYRKADDLVFTASIARAAVAGKIANCRTVLLRVLRDRPGGPNEDEMKAAADQLARLAEPLRIITDLDEVRGLEGEAARVYFGVFDHLITSEKDLFFFRGRSRRPPLDNMNALLSFLYTLLAHEMTSALEGVGLDPAVGFLHRDRPGRPGLALDLMEEFRPILADRLALALINRKQLRGKDFVQQENGAVLMTDAARKEVVTAYQKRKQEELNHPFLGEKVSIGLLPHVQALLLSRRLRGDLDDYPPFVWR
ncbi:MAG: type I-C CRISPR-associated endonuclease Cas1c [Pseudomonadota bacterium]